MPNPHHRSRRKRRESWTGRLLLWLAGTVVVLLVALVIATPWLVRAAVPGAFARFGLEASVTGGSFNPLRAELTLEGFTLGAPAQPALSLDELGMGVGLRALAGGRVEVKRLRVKGVEVNAERLLDVWKRFGPDSEPGSGGLPVGLDGVELTDVRLVSLGERIGHEVRIAHLGIADPGALLANGTSRVALRGAVGGGRVDLEVDVSMDAGTLEGAGSYRVDAVPLPGWAGLGDVRDDPLVLAAGSVSARGDVRVRFEPEEHALGLTLDGPVRVDGLGLTAEPLAAERGDASWKGRLALGWTPAMAAPRFRGDGSLVVESVRLAASPRGRAPFRVDITDVSWHGDFDWNSGLVMQAGVLGTRVEVRDGSDSKPAWRGHAEDFSWRLRAEPRDGDGTPGVTVRGFDLATASFDTGDGDARVDASVVNVSVDELRTTRSGGVVLGLAGADSVTVSAPLGTHGDAPAEIEVHALSARGLIGNADGALHAASVTAESVGYTDAGARRKLRIDGVDVAGMGLGATGLMGADAVRVESARVETPSIDVWMTGLEVERAHADGKGGYGAGRVTVMRMFQSALDGISWQASNLAIGDVEGGAGDAIRVASVELPALSLGIGDASWEAAGLRAGDVDVTASGNLNAARLGFDSLERRQALLGDLRVARLEAVGLRIEAMRGALDGVTSASIAYRWPHGSELAVDGVAAHGLEGDRSSGLAVERLSIARGSGHAIDGSRLAGSALAARGIALGVSGGVTVAGAEIGNLSGALPHSLSLEAGGVEIASLERRPDGALSARRAAARGTRLARGDGVDWTLADLVASALAWRRETGLDIEEATLESLRRARGESRLLLARSLRAMRLELVSTSDVSIASVTAGSIEGGSGAPAWNAESIDVEGFERRPDAGERVERLDVAKAELSDSRNGARLEIDRVRAQSVEVGTLDRLSASSLSTGAVRIASQKPDWPSRLTLAGLRVDAPSLRPGPSVDIDAVVAREPRLVVAQSSDNAWMWPPLPGAGGRGPESSKAVEAGSGIDLRVARFSTRGPGRIVYVDRATAPAFRYALEPVVAAFENLDTRASGTRTPFRVHGIGTRLAEVAVSGELIRRVRAFDLALEVDVVGAYLPQLNPYVRRREPVDVTAGWGELRGRIGIDDGALGGKVDVLLSGLEIRSDAADSLPANIDPEDLTLRSALALLKDDEGSIHVSIPLDAHTREPGYDFVGVFQNAFARTVRTAGRVAADLPGKTLGRSLRLIEDTVSLLPGIDAESYPPVTFLPGTHAVEAPSLAYLDQLAERMQAHPGLGLALCGHSVPRDREKLESDAADSSIEELLGEASKGVYATYGADRRGLLALAKARAGTVRRHLRDLRDVANRRLAACDAQVDRSPKEKPRVVIRVESPPRGFDLLDFL